VASETGRPSSTEGNGTTTNSVPDVSDSTISPSRRTGGGAAGTSLGANEKAAATATTPVRTTAIQRARSLTATRVGDGGRISPGRHPEADQESAELSELPAESAEAESAEAAGAGAGAGESADAGEATDAGEAGDAGDAGDATETEAADTVAGSSKGDSTLWLTALSASI
jgi:hypothetical protein